MILADTSIWVDHLRKGDRRMAELLQEGGILCHPFVIGELACGRLRDRATLLDLLAALPGVSSATHDEVLHFVSDRGLPGKGVGWIDAHLLASALLGGVTIWSRGMALTAAATTLGIAG